METFVWFLLVAVVIVAVVLYKRYVKHLNLDNLVMVTGGVKSGKTTLAVHLAIKEYNAVHRAWKRRAKLQKFFHREIDEEPLLYSNIPLACGYVPLTTDLLTRKKRFRYKSVALLSECSLIADSMDCKNAVLNKDTLYTFKLIAHETRGGRFICETQALSDNHYNLKRCLSNVCYILKRYNLPFFLAFDVRETAYSYDDANIVNVFDDDVDEHRKFVFVSKKVWKQFDTYTYSALTDDLPVVDNVVYPDSLKTLNIVTFKGYGK